MTWADVLISSVSAFVGAFAGVLIARPRLPAPPYWPPMGTRPPTFTDLKEPTDG